MSNSKYALSKGVNHRGLPSEKIILQVIEFESFPSNNGDDIQFRSLWLWDSENSLHSSNTDRTGMRQVDYIEECVRIANNLGYSPEKLLKILRE